MQSNSHLNADFAQTAVDPHLDALADYAATTPPGRSSSQRAFDVILGAILSGVLPTGQRLAEIPVARAIGVGRTPVREALMRLESEGYVTTQPRVGVVVAGNTLESIAELYEVREVLEGFASRLAARYARDADLVTIQRILSESLRPTQDLEIPRLRKLNTEFHEAVHIAAHNDQLRSILRTVINRLRLSSVSVYSAPGRAEEALGEHRAILEAIMAGDEDRADHLARVHQRRDKEVRLALMARADHAAASYLTI